MGSGKDTKPVLQLYYHWKNGLLLYVNARGGTSARSIYRNRYPEEQESIFFKTKKEVNKERWAC